MDIEAWLKTTKKNMYLRKLVLDEAGTSIGYMKQIKAGNRSPSHKLAKRLELASKKFTPSAVLRREDLRPDIWGDKAAA